MDATKSSDRAASKLRFLVVGSGGLGGVIGAHLATGGYDTTLLTRNARTAAAIRKFGLHVRGESRIEGAVLPVLTELPAPVEKPYDVVILATQPPDVEAAVRDVISHMSTIGVVVCLQNGLCEERVADQLGDVDRVIGAVVTWGASVVDLGVVERTSAGGFVVGELRAGSVPHLLAIAKALRSVGPVRLTTNLLGARWSKLAVNAAVSSLGTLGGSQLGPLLCQRFVRRLSLEVISETVNVANASGVMLEPIARGVNLETLTLSEREYQSRLGTLSLGLKHVTMMVAGFRYRRLRSSMLRALEQGRPAPVAWLNGEVTARGKRLGVPTPVNDALVAAIDALSRGRETMGLPALARVYRQTRPPRG